MITNKSKLLKDLKALWEVEVGPIKNNGVDTEVNAVYRLLIEGDDGSHDAILVCIRSSESWKERQRMLAESTFYVVKDRPPTSDELEALEGIISVPELTNAILNMADNDDNKISDVSLDSNTVVDENDLLSRDIQITDSQEYQYSEEASLVDQEWIDDFKAIYSRDPFVHEYIHLRSMQDRPLPQLYDKYQQFKDEMERVYNDYLGTDISSSELVEVYTPKLYNEDTLVEDTVYEITGSDAYAEAMRVRLSQVYNALFGSPLSEEDAAYAFETRVKADRLALTTDLNEVVISYREESDSHDMMMIELWNLVLDRDPCDVELAKNRGEYRIDSNAAHARLHRTLVNSLEFSDVVKTRVRLRYPAMPVYKVFETITRIFERHDLVQEDLDTVIDSEDAT